MNVARFMVGINQYRLFSNPTRADLDGVGRPAEITGIIIMLDVDYPYSDLTTTPACWEVRYAR